MTHDIQEVEAAIVGTAIVPKADYLRWARSTELAARARAFHLSTHAWTRITPAPTMDEECEVTARYLLDCIAINPPSDDFVHSGFEAARALASWLTYLVGLPEASSVVQRTAQRLEELYRVSDVQTRNRIETGALEHALEDPRLRQFFDHWGRDPVLAEAFNAAIRWARAHEEDAV